MILTDLEALGRLKKEMLKEEIPGKIKITFNIINIFINQKNKHCF